METLTCRIKEYIQPFERQLALQELHALAGCPVIPIDGDAATATTFSVARDSDISVLRDSLAYWRSVGDDASGLTRQLRGEATLGIARRPEGISNQSKTVRSLVSSKLPNRRCLRYATHGLHEYRGKFFPQMVRALMNIAQLPSGAAVLDPMCGSGTTLVEACLSGRSGWGLDMNPLSVFITKVKCQALTLTPTQLTSAVDALHTALDARRVSLNYAEISVAMADKDQTYLKRWFAPHVLCELRRIEVAIRSLKEEKIRNFYRVCLSNIIRGVSWQKDDDLRVRREESEVALGETVTRFLNEAVRSTRIVGAFLAERGEQGIGGYAVREADARCVVPDLRNMVGKIDAVITSPPYATALPYIDTDRLSLIYLGLLPREDHRKRDTLMIGNREVTARGRAERWEYYEKNRSLLPRSTCDLIEHIDRLNKEDTVGFRRRNLSALLASYFFDMRSVMDQMLTLLRPGGSMFLVIGNNRTTAGGQLVEIRTAAHLAEIATGLGFRWVDDIAMDMLVSRDIFRKNAVPSERIVRLDKPQ